MIYVLTHMWFWGLLAFLVGCFVGWKTCTGKRA